jgi:hydrogenase nickel incorporation protein HypA/HybF
MSFAQAIVDSILKLAAKNNARKVSCIKIEMGELLLVNPEQLEFCFQVASHRTIAEGAKLEIEYIKPEVICMLCGKRYDEIVGLCECGGVVRVEGGKDMVIKSVTMEVKHAPH